MSAANDIIMWVRRHGEVMAVSRLSVRLMEAAVKERISIRSIDEATICSDLFLAAMRREAGIIVGKPYPMPPDDRSRARLARGIAR